MVPSARTPVSRFTALALGLAALVVAGAPAAMGGQRTGSDSGLPVPRYESIASAEAFGRRGPGLDHRIDWVYRARGLPVKVGEESDGWRKVRDPAGGETWIHSKLLSPNRTVLVTGAHKPGLALRRSPDASGQTVAWLAPGVVASLRGCEGDWRRVSVPGRAEGWVPSSGVWSGEDCRLPR